jgi:hypothetical protein
MASQLIAHMTVRPGQLEGFKQQRLNVSGSPRRSAGRRERHDGGNRDTWPLVPNDENHVSGALR